ncbi:hypothetical protein QV08_04180 [Gallibacterium salpingitidis]|uniref:hypothetical protein n=1 Tax=Gallibacterium salpingitidis TaxID=505341 RepID=UPI000805D31D|nr:hypothetical protein [Gallibacterium salpingitidis]OBX08414.1 hypothetical protein QV08_04180 [Gallibacterium salpingitidis]
MFSQYRMEINLLNWRKLHHSKRYRLLTSLLLLLILLAVTVNYYLLQDFRQQDSTYQKLQQQQQRLRQNLQQIEQAQHKQRQLLNHQLQLEKIPLTDIIHFTQILSHLPLGNQGRLALAQIEINPFVGEQKNKLHFMIAGEDIAQQEFYQLQQYLLSHWPYLLELEPGTLVQNAQKQYQFTLRFNKKEGNE